MDISSEDRRFINAVKRRPMLYYKSLKYRSCYNEEQQWNEIAKELGKSPSQCKAKWRNLQKRHSAYLRNIKKETSNETAKKIKNLWYLDDSLAFLYNCACRSNTDTYYSWDEISPVISQISPVISQISPVISQTSYNTSAGTNTVPPQEKSNTPSIYPSLDLPIERYQPILNESPCCRPRGVNNTGCCDQCAFTQNKHVYFESEISEKNVIEDNQNDYLSKNICFCPCLGLPSSLHNSFPERRESETLSFFRSLISDVDALSPHRKRQFKNNVLLMLNEYINADEYSKIDVQESGVTNIDKNTNEEALSTKGMSLDIPNENSGSFHLDGSEDKHTVSSMLDTPNVHNYPSKTDLNITDTVIESRR